MNTGDTENPQNIEIIGIPNEEGIIPADQSSEISEVKRPWIFVLGSRMSGAFNLSDLFQKYFNERNINAKAKVARYIETFEAMFSDDPGIEKPMNTLPAAVFVLPEVRLTQGNLNYTLNVQEEKLDRFFQKVCDQAGVPLFFLEGEVEDISNQITTSMNELFPSLPDGTNSQNQL